jgi:hypothetical protein
MRTSAWNGESTQIPTFQKMDSEYVTLIYLQPTEFAPNETEKEKNRK